MGVSGEEVAEEDEDEEEEGVLEEAGCWLAIKALLDRIDCVSAWCVELLRMAIGDVVVVEEDDRSEPGMRSSEDVVGVFVCVVEAVGEVRVIGSATTPLLLLPLFISPGARRSWGCIDDSAGVFVWSLQEEESVEEASFSPNRREVLSRFDCLWLKRKAFLVGEVSAGGREGETSQLVLRRERFWKIEAVRDW